MPLERSSSVTFTRFKVLSSQKVTLDVTPGADPPKKYWLVQSDTKGALTIQAIDETSWLPTGKPHSITARELRVRYTPESDALTEKVRASLEKKGLPLTVEEESAAKEPDPQSDEEEFRAQFREGLTFLAAGDPEKAKLIFNKLLVQQAVPGEKRRFLLNECAIELRKNNLYKEALGYYIKVLELSWGLEDENIYLNMARARYHNGQYGACVQHLLEALRIAPENAIALRFLTWLDREKIIPKQYALQAQRYLARKPEAPLSGNSILSARVASGQHEKHIPQNATNDKTSGS